MRKLALVFAMLWCVGMTAMAQNRVVKGSVKNEKGDGVAFATVTETGTKNATNADESGNFSINVKPNAKLTVSATGYAANTVAVTGETVTVVITTA
ncbi:MAG: carboxypeptidase-like regulatory domain-containing protein, partial [Chitinophagaceae bacterium]|nr:carboxypeptidase-like regulatory domain-containing protein [Chitinophagaceae bacterium]